MFLGAIASAAGGLIKKNVTKAASWAKKQITGAKNSPAVQNAVENIKDDAQALIDEARAKAAGHIATLGTGASITAAGAIGPDGNIYQTLTGLAPNDPNSLIRWGVLGGILLLILVVLLARK